MIEEETLCSYCMNCCDRGLTSSSTCSEYKSFAQYSAENNSFVHHDDYDSQEIVYNNPPIEPPVIYSPKQYGMILAGKHKKKKH